MRLYNKYKRMVLKSAAFALTIGFAVLVIVPSSGIIKSNGVSNNDGYTKDIDKKDKEKLTDPATTFDYEGDEYLEKNAYPEINELVSAYYNATLTFDIDTLSSLVSDINQIDQTKLKAQLEYMEGIKNIICYTVKSETEGCYRAYVYYDLKIRGIETSAPALSALYVTLDSQGGYVIYLSQLDADAQSFIAEADTSKEVQNLKTLVNDRFQSVMESDSQLQTFCTMIENNGSSPETGEAATVDPNAATVDPNIVPPDAGQAPAAQ